MDMTTATNNLFDYDAHQVKHAALSNSFFNEDKRQNPQVLLSIHEQGNTTAQQPSIVDLLSMPAAEQITFEPPKLNNLYQPAAL